MSTRLLTDGKWAQSFKKITNKDLFGKCYVLNVCAGICLLGRPKQVYSATVKPGLTIPWASVHHDSKTTLFSNSKTPHLLVYPFIFPPSLHS